MPRARKHLVSPSDTPYYHVMSRCVRRAFLCGVDHYSGKSYEHRRLWFEDRIRALSNIFSIEICAYAVMSNHYHLVVRIDVGESGTWSDDEVLTRWTTLFKGPLIVQRYLQGEQLSPPEAETLSDIVRVYRDRLSCLSWFMRCLNEPIARRANAEDQCTGHFWESRFISQALKTEQALISAMAYVDLKPIRAGIAKTPEDSEYTSIAARIRADQDGEESNQALIDAMRRLLSEGDIRRGPNTIRSLASFADQTEQRRNGAVSIPIQWQDYLELVDSTGRIGVLGKRGQISENLAPILERLGMTDQQWLSASTQFERHYRGGGLNKSAG